MDNAHDTPDPVIGMIMSLRALRKAPAVEVPAHTWNVGTVDQWRNVTFDKDGKPVDPPTVSFDARSVPAAEGVDVGELYEALERVEADAEALARVHHWWIQHRRHLGTRLDDAEAVFTMQLGIARYVVQRCGPVTEAA